MKEIGQVGHAKLVELGMGDFQCMPCYEPVDVHHRIRTNSTGVVVVSDLVNSGHHRLQDQQHDLQVFDGCGSAGTTTSASHNATTVNLLRKIDGGSSNGVVVQRCQQLPVELSARSGSGRGGLAEGGGGAKKAEEDDDHHVPLRKPLTPAVSEDHHDSDYDEISIHPLSNQVSDPVGYVRGFFQSNGHILES